MPTMKMSTISKARPRLMGLYLFMMEAMMSEPPVLPPDWNTSPKPRPSVRPPSTQAMNFSSPTILYMLPISSTGTRRWPRSMNSDTIAVAIRVFTVYFRPSIFRAKRSSATFTMK